MCSAATATSRARTAARSRRNVGQPADRPCGRARLLPAIGSGADRARSAPHPTPRAGTAARRREPGAASPSNAIHQCLKRQQRVQPAAEDEAHPCGARHDDRLETAQGRGGDEFMDLVQNSGTRTGSASSASRRSSRKSDPAAAAPRVRAGDRSSGGTAGLAVSVAIGPCESRRGNIVAPIEVEPSDAGPARRAGDGACPMRQQRRLSELAVDADQSDAVRACARLAFPGVESGGRGDRWRAGERDSFCRGGAVAAHSRRSSFARRTASRRPFAPSLR
jgi:hypothetical protein